MGVTIHFQGRLPDEAAYQQLVAAAISVADHNGWSYDRIDTSDTKLLRVRENEEPWDYLGPTRGLVIHIDDNCEPIRLEFDRDLYIQEWVKTQFAGAATHINVVETLRMLQANFSDLRVQDEGEFWESGSLERLAKHIDTCDRTIRKLAAEHPG